MTELLQYLADPTDLLRAESEALLAGIVLDTKNFTMRTGGRTFEAAAFLRRAGADTSDVQRLFQSDLAGMIERYEIIRHAELVNGDIAVAAVEMGGKLKNVTVKLTAKGGKEGKLFGAITSKEISEGLASQYQLDVPKQKIVLDEPIKAFGTYEVKAKLGYEVSAKFSVSVSEE